MHPRRREGRNISAQWRRMGRGSASEETEKEEIYPLEGKRQVRGVHPRKQENKKYICKKRKNKPCRCTCSPKKQSNISARPKTMCQQTKSPQAQSLGGFPQILFLHQMTSHIMSRFHFAKFWALGAAFVACVLAAILEAASRRRIDRAREFAI